MEGEIRPVESDARDLTRRKLASEVGQIAFCLDRCGAALTCSGDSLAVNWIGDISGGENAGQICLSTLSRPNITVRIHLYLALERFSIWRLPNSDKDAFHAQFGRIAIFRALKFDSLNFTPMVRHIA